MEPERMASADIHMVLVIVRDATMRLNVVVINPDRCKNESSATALGKFHFAFRYKRWKTDLMWGKEKQKVRLT